MESINETNQKQVWEAPALMELPVQESQGGAYTTDDGDYGPSLS